MKAKISDWWNALTEYERHQVFERYHYYPLNRDFTKYRWESLPSEVQDRLRELVTPLEVKKV